MTIAGQSGGIGSVAIVLPRPAAVTIGPLDR
jgi:hypothetical protein